MSDFHPIDTLTADGRPIPEHLVQAGFRFGDKGTHTSRTIMLQELSLLLDACPQSAGRDEYLSAIVDDNCLGKRTVATRKLSGQRLSELYGLNPEILLFHVMRRFWYADDAGRPVLALLTAMARDPLLRATVEPIMRMNPGEELGRQQITDVLVRVIGDRLSESTLDKVVRNAASSWTQSGHLKGRGRKTRCQVQPTPIAVAYALLLGYILGVRSRGLFGTLWARVLDLPREELIYLAMDAKRLGLLDMSQSGDVIEVSFARILTENERQLIHGTG